MKKFWQQQTIDIDEEYLMEERGDYNVSGTWSDDFLVDTLGELNNRLEDINIGDDGVNYEGDIIYQDEIEYKFNEPELLEEIRDYIDQTYSEHYGQNKIQSAEFIISSGKGTGFCLGNVIKYADRYGKKDGYNRKDLVKIIHYGIIALYNHDLESDNQ